MKRQESENCQEGQRSLQQGLHEDLRRLEDQSRTQDEWEFAVVFPSRFGFPRHGINQQRVVTVMVTSRTLTKYMNF